MSERIRVVVADDHVLVADALVGVLTLHDDLAVTGIAHTLAAVDDCLSSTAADVVLLDYRFPDGYGTHAVPRLLTEHPGLAIVLLTASDDPATIREALHVGCAAYLEKAAGMTDLAECVRAVAAGRRWLSPAALDLLAHAPLPASQPLDDLTRREMQVLILLADGCGPGAIARELHISRNTVRNHVQAVLEKLGAHTRLEAVATAMREGLLASA